MKNCALARDVFISANLTMLCLGGQIAFKVVLLAGSRSELDDPPAFTKVIKNRALARDVLKILMIF